MWIKKTDGVLVDVTGCIIVASQDGMVKAVNFSGMYFELGKYLNEWAAKNIVSDIFETIEAGQNVYEMPKGVE